MLVVTRFAVAEVDGSAFAGRVADALRVFAERPGFQDGRLGRAVDDPAVWILVTEWAGVGAYRRALGNVDVRMRAVPLLAEARDEAGAFEVLLDARAATAAAAPAVSDRSADAATIGPGRTVRPSDPGPIPAEGP